MKQLHESLRFVCIEHGSSDYDVMIRLRISVLLQPLNVPETFIKRETESGDFLLAAFSGNAMVGCCVLTPKAAGILQLRQMAVDRRFQRQGVGASLLRFAEATACSNGFRTVLLHARDAVLAFYLQSGYQIASEQFYEVGIPHHVMEKQL